MDLLKIVNMQKVIIGIILLIIFSSCGSYRQTERIVINDTTRIVLIDTTHIKIIDTLEIKHIINEIVFDTFYNYVDSVVVREAIDKVYSGITTIFKYDTLLSVKEKIIALKLLYDGNKIFIDINEKQLKDSVIVKEKISEQQVEGFNFAWWHYLSWGAIIGAIILIVLVIKLK
jgi:hypothetical protein